MSSAHPAPEARPLRLRRAQRDQVVPIPAKLDALLPVDHLARLVWAAVERLDVSAFAANRVVVEGGPGRASADPRVLVALWLYATSQGVVHARELDRLCTEHLAYRWLCGGVSMNYHTLSDFRVEHGAALEGLFVQVLGRLRAADLVAFQHVAQDGLRVRASAGAASFRRPAAGRRWKRRWPRRRRSWCSCRPPPRTPTRAAANAPRGSGPPASASPASASPASASPAWKPPWPSCPPRRAARPSRRISGSAPAPRRPMPMRTS